VKYGKVYFDDVKVGDELPPLVKGPIQQIQLTRYAGASGDFNPIHQDDEFARAAGMGAVFAHGMLSMGFVGQAVTDWSGAGTVRKLGVRFAALVRLKDVVTCRGRVVGKSSKDDVHLVELEVWAENQRAEKVVTGRATVALPRAFIEMGATTWPPNPPNARKRPGGAVALLDNAWRTSRPASIPSRRPTRAGLRASTGTRGRPTESARA